MFFHSIPSRMQLYFLNVGANCGNFLALSATLVIYGAGFPLKWHFSLIQYVHMASKAVLANHHQQYANTRMHILDTPCFNLIISLFGIHLVIFTSPGKWFLMKKTTSYLTFSIGTGGIDERTGVIIEASTDRRVQNQYWSAVLILTVVVDEMKWLAELVGEMQAGGCSSRVFIEMLILLSSRLCWGSDLYYLFGFSTNGFIILTPVSRRLHAVNLHRWDFCYLSKYFNRIKIKDQNERSK